MALLELSVRIFSSLLDVIFIGVRMACRIRYSMACPHVYKLRVNVPSGRRALHLFAE